MNTTQNIYFDLSQLRHVGDKAIIGKTVRIRHPERASIGDGTIIDDFTYISCELITGRCCHIASSVTMAGGGQRIVLGDYVGVSAGSSLHAVSTDYITASLDIPSVPPELRFGGIAGDIVLADFVLLGAHTVVLPGVELPEGVATAAHTVLRKRKYEPWTLYGGPDCRPLCKRDNTELMRRLGRTPQQAG